ncbi:MAG: SDR family oxidoreductase [Bacteroidota bacterium]|nr:SDR family oxidoreductase [Bacteroidota bacterium]
MHTNQVLLINDGGETGYVTAQALIDTGATLLLIDRVNELPATLQSQLNEGKFEMIHFDFYQIENIEATLKPIFAEGKIFDSLIYAAGIGGVRPLGMSTPNFVQQMMNANFFAFLEWVRVVCKKQRFAAGGSVVAISSVSSIRGLKSKIAYTASKAALDASIKGLAAELADRKIRVNSIQKGWVRADMQHGFIQDNMALNENNDLAKQVLGIIESDEIASLVQYLISEVSKSITGTNILLDGGYTL